MRFPLNQSLSPTMVDDRHVILPEDRKEAQRIFNSLPVKSQLEMVLKVHGKERLQYLFLSDHPEQILQQLPELEVFLTVKEVGEKDCLELISMTTPDQFQYLLDLDLWKKDRLDPEKILQWMETLLEAGESKVVQFIQSTDLEFMALLMKKFLYVITLEGEHVEEMDKTSLFTLNQFHFIGFKGKKTREVFEPFLGILYRTDEKIYRRLMDALMVELESELEEIGYHLRNSRLAGYGFPDFEEALEIYRFVNPDSLTKEGRVPREIDREEGGREGSMFYLTFQQEGPFFSSILSKMDDPQELDRLKQEITTLCNRAIVAEAIDLSNIAAMERVIKKVYHTLNLGLQYLSQGEERKALDILRSLRVQRLFQCGVSTTIVLRKKAESILKGSWFSADRENLVFLDPPHFEKFEGILRRRPVLYRDWTGEDFKDLRDLKEADDFLEFIETTTHFLRQELKVSPHSLRELDLTDCQPKDWREITLSTIFLTSFANQILQGASRFEAIAQARVKDFLARIFERDSEGKGVIRMEMKEAVRNWLSSNEKDALKRQHLLAFKDFCLDLLEEEYGKIPSTEKVDPRFVKGLLIRE